MFVARLFRKCRTIPIVAGQRQMSCGTYTPRRALLYVPGNDEKKIKKVASMNVDCAVLDCEDGVSIHKKAEARSLICEALDKFEFGNGELCVRVNSVDNSLCKDDLREILNVAKLPSTIVLPKVESKDQISWFSDQLKTHLSVNNKREHRLNLLLMVESAKSLLDFRDMCTHCHDLSHKKRFNLDGVIFGSDDYCADIGATRTSDARELLYARQKLVTTAKCFKIQVIDLVHIDYKDLDGLKKASEESARMGFTGKQVIHPGQIPVVQNAYSPSEEKILWATELITAFNEQQKEGKGAIVFRGNMIDMPLVLQAQNILKLSQFHK